MRRKPNRLDRYNLFGTSDRGVCREVDRRFLTADDFEIRAVRNLWQPFTVFAVGNASQGEKTVARRIGAGSLNHRRDWRVVRKRSHCRIVFYRSFLTFDLFFQTFEFFFERGGFIIRRGGRSRSRRIGNGDFGRFQQNISEQVRQPIKVKLR